MPTSIEQVIAEAAASMEAIHKAREVAISTSRTLIRQSANTIRAIHRNNIDEARGLLQSAAKTAADLRNSLVGQPAILIAGYTQDALKEYAEARLVFAFICADELPAAAELQVEPAAYLNGMAEAASELRRYILDSLRRGVTDRCEELLAIMDEVYSLLITVDYPDAVTGGLRRTTDALRAVLERTRGDMTTAIRQDRMARALAGFEQRLGADPQHPGQPLAPDVQEED